jgi:uncharacterized lipoprotein YajG
MKLKYLAILTACVSFIMGCGKDPSSGTISTPADQTEKQPVSANGVAHVDISEAKDFKSGEATGLSLHLQLTGDKDTNLTIHANKIYVETKKGESRSSWKFIQFFYNVKTSADVQMTTLQIGDT